jgi:hypothetical protein
MRNATQAATWAEARAGSTGWNGRSLSFVLHAWDLPTAEVGREACREWNALPAACRHTDRQPPVGAPCFWAGPAPDGQAGIVVEYRGGVPLIACCDTTRPGRIDVVPMSRVDRDWLGWTSALHGRTLPLPNGHAALLNSAHRRGRRGPRSELRVTH